MAPRLGIVSRFHSWQGEEGIIFSWRFCDRSDKKEAKIVLVSRGFYCVMERSYYNYWPSTRNSWINRAGTSAATSRPDADVRAGGRALVPQGQAPTTPQPNEGEIQPANSDGMPGAVGHPDDTEDLEKNRSHFEILMAKLAKTNSSNGCELYSPLVPILRKRRRSPIVTTTASPERQKAQVGT